MRSILSTIALGVSWASFVVASRPNVPRAPAITAEAQIQQYATGWFDQLLDHDKPALGTFKQRYFWSTEYWKGPGSPVDSSLSLDLSISDANSDARSSCSNQESKPPKAFRGIYSTRQLLAFMHRNLVVLDLFSSVSYFLPLGFRSS